MTLRSFSIWMLSCLIVAVPSVVVGEDAATASRPVKHLVLFEFKKEVSSKDRQRILEDFGKLPSKVPGIVRAQWGLDNSSEGLQKGFTHCFLMTFETQKALESYMPHPDHQAFVQEFRPVVNQVFVFDFYAEKALPAAAPGRVHHLVFFKFKDSAASDQIEAVLKGFSSLPLQIPGLLRYQAGENTSKRGLNRGLTHAFIITFINKHARDDYLPHPAHKAFVEKVGPIVEDVLVLDFTVLPSRRSLLVTDGLEPYRVYQRDEQGKADLKFSGIASDDGSIEARLLHGRRMVAGFDWREVGEAVGGRFEAVLPGVPSGGEYTVEIRRRDGLGDVAETTDVPNVLVGDLWILAGQSNMQGVGDLVDVEPPSSLVHCFTMAHRWELAVEPLHWLIDSRDPVHSGKRLKDLDETGRRQARARERGKRTKGTGLGLPFAKHMATHTGVPVGLIASAHGGTSMKQWDPSLKDRGGESLYGSMIKQVRRAGGRVKGVLWYQGESDTREEAVPLFAERFRNLVAAFRRDLGDPVLPFYYVQIGRFVVNRPAQGAHWDAIQELQRRAAREIPQTAGVASVDLSLDDRIHIGTGGLKRLGARLGKIARRELFAETCLSSGPRFAKARLEKGGRTIRVYYSGVKGSLHPAEQVARFSIRTPEGKDLPILYNASVDPEEPTTVVLKLYRDLPQGARLWYGAGLNPVCNLVDSEDMAALAFGPADIERHTP